MHTNRFYIGLSTGFHDPAVALVGPDGDVLFAEATERFLQHKRALNCPPDALDKISSVLREYCDPRADIVVATTLSRPAAAGLALASLFCSFAWTRRAGVKRDRVLQHSFETRIQCKGLSSAQSTAGLYVLRALHETHGHLRATLRRYSHHLTHAAYACYTSPFPDAACAVLDGSGETGSATLFGYRDGRLRRVKTYRGTQSLGFLYSLLTELCGFDVMKGEEWKMMGLAPYGKFDDRIYRLVKKLCNFDHSLPRFGRISEIRETIAELSEFGAPPGSDHYQAADLAYVGQQVFSEIMLDILRGLEARKISPNLAYAGGCALNSSCNGLILRETGFERLFVPSAPADDGNAIGAALLAYYDDHPGERRQSKFQSPYLGAKISPKTVERLIQYNATPVRHVEGRICENTAALLAQGRLVGWLQGRAEFGPRALGNRSILADPRRKEVKDRLNENVKFREMFRPFAPSILHEFGNDYFEHYQESPYMERTLRFKAEVRERVPGVVHVDNTGRLQTVKREWNEKFYDLIEAFHKITDVPLLLNTSFNVMGRPIVHSLEDAVALFYTTGLDALVVDDHLLVKGE